MNRKCAIFLVIIMTFASISKAQKYAIRETFLDADSWFYYQEYEEAVSLFLQVYQEDTTNANVAYKIGYCYLNIEGKKSKAIPYLKQAARDYTFTYRDNTYTEKKAPADAIFYLGNAYLIDNKINKAKKTYQRFRKILEERNSLFVDPENRYNLAYLDKQIATCDIALAFMDTPISYVADNLKAPVNSGFNDQTPVISGDGNTMVFVRKLKFYDAIFYTTKKGGKWTAPINLMGQIGIDDNAHPTSLNFDGTELYLYREERLAGNIFVSHLEEGIWSKAKKLNNEINTKYWEAHASISPDGKQLFFVSNRESSIGDLDIFVADRIEGDTWGNIRNLGSTINTPWNENTPFLSNDQSILFFSSEGHKSMGGYDIFYSLKVGELWTTPKNIGYPLSTTDNDLFFTPLKDGSEGFMAQFSKKGLGGKDIYQVAISKITRPSDVRVEGQLVMDNPNDRNIQSFNIFLIDKNSLDTLLTLSEDQLKNIEHFTPSGAPHLVYESYLGPEKRQFFISQPYTIEEVFLKPIPLKKPIAEQQTSQPEIKASQTHYKVEQAGQRVEIKLNVKDGETLLLDTYVNGTFTKRDTFQIKHHEFIYEYQPIEGENKLLFSLLGKDNQKQTEEVFVSYIPLEQEIASALDLSDTEYQLNADGKKVKIRLAVKEGSKLIVETYVGDELIKTEEFDVESDEFIYEYTPTSEDTHIDFKVINPDNSIEKGTIAIKQKPVTDELAALIKAMQAYSNNQLKVVLPRLQSAEYNNSDSLLNTLREKAQRDAMFDQALDATIAALLMQLNITPQEFLQGLKTIATPPISTALDQVPENPETKLAVLQFLYKNQQEFGYNEEAIDALLDAYLAQQYTSPDTLHEKLQQMANTDPFVVLKGKDKRILSISTIEDLKNYIDSLGLPLSTAQILEMMIEGLHLDYLSNKFGFTPKELATKPKAEKQPNFIIQNLAILLTGLGFVIILLFIILRKRKKRDKKI